MAQPSSYALNPETLYKMQQGMGAAKLEARPIDEALSCLEGRITELNQTIAALEQKMNPYLLPESPAPVNKDMAATPRAAVTMKIHMSAYEISMAIDYLHRLMGRID